MEIWKKVRETISDFQMFSEGERVGIGLSGGIDSVVLVDLLERLREELKLELYLLHLEHGIRGEESKRDLEFVKELAEKKGLPLFFKEVNVPLYAKREKLSLEEAARNLRYLFFEEAQKELHLQKIALGHTADDQVETFLLALLRGAGLKGLKGMPPKRGPYVRPLIRVWRKEIEEYALQRGLRYVVDRSNFDLSRLRNRIRLELIEFLKLFNPRIKERILEMTEILQQENEVLDLLTEKHYEELVQKEGKGVYFDLEALRELPQALRLRLVAFAFRDLTGLDLSFRHRNSIRLLIEGKGGDVELPRGLLASRQGRRLYIGERPKSVEIQPKELRIPGITEIAPGLFIEASFLDQKEESPSPQVALLDLDKLTLPLKVRSPQEGDRFIPSGMANKKKLQDFFVDLKVPRFLRKGVPIVVSGDEICWVGGFRVDERFRAKEDTQRVLRLRLIKEKP
jgi:tRNA(Ile)-lysidine synthase